MPRPILARRQIEQGYREEAILVAKDFSYGDSVIESIKKAKSENEISRIMISARHKKFG